MHAPGDLAAIPDGAVVLIDGLIASPDDRVRQVVLLHMPQGDQRELLEAATAVVVTSDWTRRHLEERYGVSAHVAEPGVDAAELAPGGGGVLCVGAVTPVKGHDVLVDALATVDDLRWTCTCVGSLAKDPAFAEAIQRRAPRVRFAGPLVGPALDRAYAAADLLVLPSRAETYGMVVTEALARGVPVLASDVGGVREALGDDGAGLLVPPGDPAALGAALRRWLGDAELRECLRRAARKRRATLRGWEQTAADVAAVLRDVTAVVAR
jgi:glycosyltransferase involved in cell wall biosynthesis